MKEFGSINDILDFAIKNEQLAVDFYNQLAGNAKNDEMKAVFMQFAKEEMGHKSRLTKIKEEGSFNIRTQEVLDLKMSDYLVDVEPRADLSYEEALVLAMKREKSAFKLYTRLAEKAPDENLKKIFNSLAIEESKHKLRFELEYDEYVMREN
jgi:rubrerythrin